MRIQQEAELALADGFDAIARQYGLPKEFPSEVLSAATAAVSTTAEGPSPDRISSLEIPYVTLDPATSTDLDQAFHLHSDGDEIVLSYALSDLSSFAPEGGPVELEAWRRGLTIYGLAKKVPLYPQVISQKAASLLPDGPRPAVQVTVGINAVGDVRLRNIQRITCASRQKLAYTTVQLRSIPHLEQFAQRMWLNESQRGAVRFDFPQQEVVADSSAPGGVRLQLRSPLYSEVVNSALSLAVNMALGQFLVDQQVGLFRVMDEPHPRAIDRLRREAHALQIPWGEDEPIKALQKRLDPNNLVHQRFLLILRLAGGRASYATYSQDRKPWHAAVGAIYAHATAPMRRLADRYVLDLVCLLYAGKNAPTSLLDKLELLPDVMASADKKAKNVDRAVIDLIEAVSLQHRVGEVLEAEVVDAEAGIVQTFDSAIRSRAAKLTSASDGQIIRVRIDKADPATRQILLTAI
jgi:exoribonuclease R